jgi:hypothetical protein
MKKYFVWCALIVSIIVGFNAENAFGQGNFKGNIWNGEWNFSDSFQPGRLIIKPLANNKFKFTLTASNGANQGEISGVAKVKGSKAFFDDRESTEKDASKEGCLLTFTNSGSGIAVKQSEKCSYYAGNAVYFEGNYAKGKPKKTNDTFVKREVFPNAAIEAKFKSLTGKDYENFLASFQLIYDETDADGLGAKVLSGCVRGICPWNTGIIMFDAKGNIWAAVMSFDDKDKASANYYTNVPAWTDKLPKTIENWITDKRESNKDLTVVYKNKTK